MKKEKNKFFQFKDIDTHYIIIILGVQFTVRHKSNFKWQETTEFGLTIKKRNPTKLIVSLTTFPARINDVHLTINTLLRQSTKPDRLLLWLAETQFPNLEKDLPKKLLELKEFGLEIKWCEDLKSYKKLVPTIREYPDDIIVTADDDMYYKEDWVEGLYNAYLENPKNIYTRRGCRVAIQKNHIKVLKPRDYNFLYDFPIDFNNLLMGGSGTLYPPNSLHSDILNIEQIKTLIPTHDDIYFWVMGILNNTKIGVVGGFDYSFYYTEAAKKNGLCTNNTSMGSGMSSKEAFEKIKNKYPQILKILKEAKKND